MDIGEPQNYMFAEMRYDSTHQTLLTLQHRISADGCSAVLRITKATDILDHIYSLSPGKQEEAMESIRKIERAAMAVQKPQPGLVGLMEYLTLRNVRKGICTRNFE
jgi:hypothetical protein